MASVSPADTFDNPSSSVSGGYGSNDGGKSSLPLNLGFLKNFSDKKTTRDGQPPKKRGPKPDSKPALTRRQELNRQAQRTHRERKELYIKALEQEVMRLKENFTRISQDKEALALENQQLKELLAKHGIPWTGPGALGEFSAVPSAGYTSSGSISGSYALDSQGYSPPPQPNVSQYPPDSFGLGGDAPVKDRSIAQQQVQQGVDYDQAGIDFVLALERPCMDHMQMMADGSTDLENPACGHVLMASCPPIFDGEQPLDLPFGHTPIPDGGEQKTWDLSKSDLANLMDLSKRLNLDGEITPVMAWGMILAHPRFNELTANDIQSIREELRPKTRCYGFGAVLEEFEVRDALENHFSTAANPNQNMMILENSS